MPGLVVDSSVFISAIGIKDIHSQPSQQFFSRITAKDIIIPTLVIVETIVVLSKQGSHQIPTLLDYLLSLQVIELNQPFIKNTIRFLTQKLPLKTSDLLVATTAKLHQASLITWDKQLLSKANTLCSALTPKQFINPTQN